MIPQEGLEILWELKVAGVFIFCLLSAVITVFSLLIRGLNKQMVVLNKQIEEKDAVILSLHQKSEDHIQNVTAVVTECIDLNHSLSEGFKELAAALYNSAKNLEKIARSTKAK